MMDFLSALNRQHQARARLLRAPTRRHQAPTRFPGAQVASSAAQLEESAAQVGETKAQVATSTAKLASSAAQLATSAAQLPSCAGELQTSPAQLRTWPPSDRLATIHGRDVRRRQCASDMVFTVFAQRDSDQETTETECETLDEAFGGVHLRELITSEMENTEG